MAHVKKSERKARTREREELKARLGLPQIWALKPVEKAKNQLLEMMEGQFPYDVPDCSVASVEESLEQFTIDLLKLDQNSEVLPRVERGDNRYALLNHQGVDNAAINTFMSELWSSVWLEPLMKPLKVFVWTVLSASREHRHQQIKLAAKTNRKTEEAPAPAVSSSNGVHPPVENSSKEDLSPQGEEVNPADAELVARRVKEV